MAASLKHRYLCSLNKVQATNQQLNPSQFEEYFLEDPLFFMTSVFHRACSRGFRVLLLFPFGNIITEKLLPYMGIERLK